MCSKDEQESCRRAHHRDEAKVCRWILGDHDEPNRPMWREILARHVRLADIPCIGQRAREAALTAPFRLAAHKAGGR